MTDVFGVERAVEPSAEDPAVSTDASGMGDGLFNCRAASDQRVDATSHALGMHTRIRPLSADEEAALETRQRDPLALASHPPERFERHLAAHSVGDHLGASVPRALSALRQVMRRPIGL